MSELGKEDWVKRLSTAIQDESPHMICMGDGLPEHAILTGWLLICEWAGADGELWLTQTRPDGQPYWRSLGLAHAAIHGLTTPSMVEEDE